MKKSILSLITGLILFFIPFNVLAHGTEEHAGEEITNYWNYGIAASLLIVVIFLVLFVLVKSKMKRLNLKTKDNREKRNSLSKQSTIYKWVLIVSLLSVIPLVIFANVNKEEKITFKHIHGLGYTSDGEELYVPAHDGLRVYKDGSWTNPKEGDNHDYMGFSMFSDGFFSSGHPAPGSDLANPLGIVKSTDKGKTLEQLGLYGEIDFHGMTVGYDTREIYVFNPSENSQMDQMGFYYSVDEAKTWTQSELKGLQGKAIGLAAHPTKQGIVTIGTNQGIFLSDNYGNSFEKLPVSGAVSAVSFDHQNNLLIATESNVAKLLQLNLSTNEINELSIPDLKDDVITYVKQNPAHNNELVFATKKRDIYFSHDEGETWEQSVDEGIAITH